jgi:hypothetical protein
MKKTKVVVLKRFTDKYDNTIRYEVGDEREFEAARADDLIERGLAAPVDMPVKNSDAGKADSEDTAPTEGRIDGNTVLKAKQKRK